MKLSPENINQFNDEGYLFFPELFSKKEIAKLQNEVPKILARTGPEIIREKMDNKVARLAFGVHSYSEPYNRMMLHPRMLEPVKQLLNDDVYLHQSRLNPKYGFGYGGGWDWHQDYPPFKYIDGMRDPKCIMASIFIDDCTPVTSPLLVIPGSHKNGLIESKLHEDAKKDGGYALHHIDNNTLKNLANESTIEPVMGPAGSVAFVICTLVHGSGNNVSPWRRAILYMNYNTVSNACTEASRPWFQNNRDFTPLKSLDDDCLTY